MGTKHIKKRRAAVLSLAFLGVLILWTLWSNTALECNTYIVESHMLPAAFDGYRIAHISDLHSAEMGTENEKLLTMLREAEPDMIAITGDLIDSRDTDVGIALRFTEEAVKIAPCYYVTGNHEASTSLYADLRQGMMDQGVVILENERLELTRSGESISVLGVNDPSVHKDFASDSDARIMEGNLNALVKEENSYTILLSHRPELFDLYVSSGVNLVLSGHAHGGQFRLPFIGGLIAPNQGLCPTYDAGMFSEDGTDMIVSRGIGNSVIPIRFHNRPEIVCVELRRN